MGQDVANVYMLPSGEIHVQDGTLDADDRVYRIRYHWDDESIDTTSPPVSRADALSLVSAAATSQTAFDTELASVLPNWSAGFSTADLAALRDGFDGAPQL